MSVRVSLDLAGTVSLQEDLKKGPLGLTGRSRFPPVGLHGCLCHPIKNVVSWAHFHGQRSGSGSGSQVLNNSGLLLHKFHRTSGTCDQTGSL